MEDPHRYLDTTVVGHFRRRLADCAADDGAYGPKATLPAVLGVVAAIERNARKVTAEVRRDLLSVAAQAAEFTGWLYRDVGIPDLADYWRDRATEWAQEAGDHTMPGYILLKKSQSAWDERDGLRMLTLAQAVQDGPWQLPDVVRAEAAQQEARGHAMVGELDLVERKLNQAQQLLADSAPGDDVRAAGPTAHYERPLFAMQRAICYHEAGQAAKAVGIYRETLSPTVFSPRDYGYFVALMADAVAAVAQPDEAATRGMEALQIAATTHSVRTVHELLRLGDRLAVWADRPAVRQFLDALPHSGPRCYRMCGRMSHSAIDRITNACHCPVCGSAYCGSSWTAKPCCAPSISNSRAGPRSSCT
jgi:hypothetical protein